ncbi:hypothetical protein P7E02_22130 [Enterococcus hulanensis]|uniref:hypothetical protein n=1 Tax=Enterococcus hulanensis TaxID=2559929 RepID=UPI002890D313|nr:hypothetical protein [Enterococcus hulanensis]MDT2662599.1 hypothetical protein [Enterococcus hulanensis]
MKKIVLFGDSLLAGVMNGEPSDILDKYILDELAGMGFPRVSLSQVGQSGRVFF